MASAGSSGRLAEAVSGAVPPVAAGRSRDGAPKNTRRPLYAAQPLVTTIATTAARSGSRYNSIQASVRQRSWNGLEFVASYTLGKVTTNNRGFYGCSEAPGPRA